MEKTSVYKRILLKLSGEAIANENGFGINDALLDEIALQIKNAAQSGVEIGIVIGAGNFWRGRQTDKMDKSVADYMGMMATVLNCLALQDSLERMGVKAEVQTALAIEKVAKPFNLKQANNTLEDGGVVIFGCGTGNPYFTTDTGAALRALEIQADALLLAKNIDGVYDSDPRKNPEAKKFDEISYREVIERNLKATDMTAITMCMDNNMPIVAFGLKEENSIMRAISGECFGTVIK